MHLRTGPTVRVECSADTWRRVWRSRPDRTTGVIPAGVVTYSPGGTWPKARRRAQSWGRSFVRLVGEVAPAPSENPRRCADFPAREGGFGLSTMVEAVPSRYRATVASHYCELSHCGVTAAAYAADSVFSARYSRAGPHDPPPARCSVPGPIKDGDRLSGKSSIKRLSGS